MDSPTASPPLWRGTLALGFVAAGMVALGAYFAATGSMAGDSKAASGVPPVAIPQSVDGVAALSGATQDQRLDSIMHRVADTLARFPPTSAPNRERLAALTALDTVLHDDEAPNRPAVQEFFHQRIEAVVADLRQSKVKSGAVIGHIYNHGFVVRTASVTLCFDLIRAKYLPGFALDVALMQQITDQCDVLFVSHAHSDHAETLVADLLLREGKPVVAPLQLRYREPVYSKVTHLDPIPDVVHSLPIQHGRAMLEVIAYPGHQEEIDNNVVLVTTPEGITIAHTGDQWNKDADFAWIDRVGSRYRVDILLPNDWTFDIARLVKGFDPALVIPGHANELGHEVAKRQPYMLSVDRKAGSFRFGGVPMSGYDAPLVILTWGESFHYDRAEKIAEARPVTTNR